MNYLKLLCAALAVILFCGCSDNDDSTPQILEILSPANADIAFGSETPLSTTVAFHSSASWTAEVSGTGFTISPKYGNGSDAAQEITITAESNFQETENPGLLTISSGNKKLTVTITQAAYAGFNQVAANARLAVNKFTAFDVASIDENAGTVEFCDELNCYSSGWFAWNEEWQTKTYTNGGKRYRLPTALEMQLLMPGYDNQDHVYFGHQISNSMKEFLPATIFGCPGGEGTSYFKTSSEKIEVGTNPQFNYACYALRFMGTEQRSAYFYRWYNSGSETDAYLAIRIKAVDNDDCDIADIADNDEFWKENYIQYNIPACGMNFSGSIFLSGASGDYWTGTRGGLDTTNPSANDYSITLTFADNYGFLGDSNHENFLNVRMVEAE